MAIKFQNLTLTLVALFSAVSYAGGAGFDDLKIVSCKLESIAKKVEFEIEPTLNIYKTQWRSGQLKYTVGYPKTRKELNSFLGDASDRLNRTHIIDCPSPGEWLAPVACLENNERLLLKERGITSRAPDTSINYNKVTKKMRVLVTRNLRVFEDVTYTCK